MAREHEKKHEKHEDKMKHRARGGRTMREDAEEEMKKREGEAQKRKRGGRVHGEKAKHRPDRRARGGAMAEPTTEAGKMSKPDYEGHKEPNDVHAKGKDRD